MPGREGVYVAPVRPAEATAAATVLQEFLAGSAEGVDPNTAAHYIQADPANPELVADMKAKIQASGPLSHLYQAAYVIARDLTLARHSGVVGFGVFTRIDEMNVLIDGLHVAPDYRGRHIGPAILSAACTELEITTVDYLTADVAESDTRTQRFWGRIGFIPEPLPHLHPREHPSASVPHREYTGHQPIVLASVDALLNL
jgi:ribosomal protein S18 acetylase RimI-like enzyme